MLTAWRLVRSSFAHDPFSGEGAAKYGGRWNSAGTRVVYCSGSLALASLELIVHHNPLPPFKFIAFQLQFDEKLITTVDMKTMPRDWRAQPGSLATRKIGDGWVTSGRSAVLQVPSIIVPNESNFLINPLHKDYRKIKLGKGEPFAFDQRLLGR